jgi:hypothetical protein
VGAHGLVALLVQNSCSIENAAVLSRRDAQSASPETVTKERIRMKNARRLLAMLSSCLLVAACTVAFTAAAAQAEGNWFVKGKALEGLVPSVNWEADGGSYAFLLPALNLELVFKKFTLNSATLTPEGKGTVEFTLSEGKVNSISPLEEVPCTVGNLTFSGTTNLFLHNGKTYNALPVNTITTYGKGCILAEKNTVKGTVVLEDPEGNFEGETVNHLIRVAPAALFPTLKLLFGAQNVVMDGSWIMSLTGIHKGMSWSGIG